MGGGRILQQGDGKDMVSPYSRGEYSRFAAGDYLGSGIRAGISFSVLRCVTVEDKVASSDGLVA